jgi:dTDP-4-amino-4,6-dideoxygalactose transaminase
MAAASPLKVPFHRVPITTAERNAVDRVVKSGWLTTGPEATRFEQEFAAAVDAHGAVAVSSGTAALHVGLELLALLPGDEVIVPSMTFTATAAAVLMAGLTPVIADVDPVSLNLTPETVQAVQTRRTKALLPVHYGGNPSGLLPLLAYAQPYKLRVVDDAAHAFPARVGPHPVGSHPALTDATCFSFYATKTLTTGEGGMLTVRDPGLIERARRLINHGVDHEAYQRSRTSLYHYEVTEHGYKYNLPDVLAALGRVQLQRATDLWQKRTALATFYTQALAPLEAKGYLTCPQVAEGYTSAWYLYPIRLTLDALKADWSRDRLAERLREYGIGCSLYYRPLHRHKFWTTSLGLDGRRYPHADRAYDELLALPCWPDMERRQRRAVVDTLGTVLAEAVR